MFQILWLEKVCSIGMFVFFTASMGVLIFLAVQYDRFIKDAENMSITRRKELKAAGIKRRDKAAVEAYFAEKKRLADEKAAADAAAAAEAARLQREANPTTEDLLKQILAEMKTRA